MKQFKEFSSEQTHINEIGPIGATIAGAMGLLGLGIGGYKLYKKSKDKIKGYRETKKEKEQNQEQGVYVDIKKWDDKAGKVISQPIQIAKPGSKEARMSNDDIEKKKKELQKKEDPRNTAKEAEFGIKQKEKSDRDTAKMSAKDFVGKEVGEIPDGMVDAVKKIEKEKLKDHSSVIDYMKRWDLDKQPKGWRKFGRGKDFEYVTSDEYKKRQAAKKTKKEHKVLQFGEFIAEDIMKDLKKISKSKKDSEISLDDGSDIPIDPLTSEILVKYIEGLSSSEKNRTIKQIQRTERAFMKVLGKAHEG
tara:strand:- start:105 stop:1016 length:912 start_codon:yes stop_codon:yes gene_type:complete